MRAGNTSKNVLVVDDHSLYREGILSLFEKWDDFDVIGEASSGEEAIAFCRAWPPNIVLMDVKMPGMGGIEATKVITSENPDILVVMLSVYVDQSDLVFSVRNGARGYLMKNTHAKRLHNHLRNVVSGQCAICDEVASVCFDFIRNLSQDQVPQSEQPSAKDVNLTDHEKHLIRLIAMGYSNRDIADRMFVGEGTIKKQISTLLTKIDADNRVQAAVYALRSGLAD